MDEELNLSTILIVDDSKINIDILINILDEYDILVARDGESALEILNEESVDLVLLDIVMPQMDGYAVCQNIRNNIKIKDIPIIFITSKSDEESIEYGFDIGGNDYITKPFKTKELLARVKTQLKLQTLINNLDYLSSHDKMTGIYNRGKFFDLATNIWKNKQTIFVIMIDIDKFKNINDTYGHPVGDKVIKNIAYKINTYTDDKSIFGRIGGEEFLYLTFDNTIDYVKQKAEMFRQEVKKIKIDIDNNETISCTISVGISQRDDSMKSLDDLFGKVDLALYDAKKGGRDRVVFRHLT